MNTGTITQLTTSPGIPVKVVKKEMSDDMRRLCLSMINLIKREYPNDWRKMLAELAK
jgi:hypothetical protein